MSPPTVRQNINWYCAHEALRARLTDRQRTLCTRLRRENGFTQILEETTSTESRQGKHLVRPLGHVRRREC